MSKNLEEKTFVLGIGVQKAGTSWLFKYLDNRDDCFMSPIKELHYFDTKHRPDLSAGINRRFLKELVEKVRAKGGVNYDAATGLGALIDRVSMIYDPTAYRRFFEERVPEPVDFFGEITPAYALLSKEGFEDIRDQFPNRRILLIFRDPIERHFSLMRMKEKKGKIASAQESFLDFLDWRGAAARSDYPETITNVFDVFDEKDVHVSFYEELFNDDELKKICDFIGLPFLPGEYDVRVNAGGSSSNTGLTDDQRNTARERLAPVYDFCRDYFGERLPASWNL